MAGKLLLDAIGNLDDLFGRDQAGAFAPELVGDLEPEPSILKCAHSAKNAGMGHLVS
jgi:hypothetical protein